MKCAEALRRLDAYLDQELAADVAAALADHLQGCPTCRQELAERRWLDELLAAPAGQAALGDPARPLPPDFAQRVCQLVTAEAADRPGLLWPWLRQRWSLQQVASLVYALGTTSAVAAGVALLVGWERGSGQFAALGDRAQGYWMELQVTIDVLGTWISRWL